MKLLVVCQYFYPEQFRVNDICFELVKHGHEVSVLTGLPNYPAGMVDRKYTWFKNRSEQTNGVHIFRSWLIGRGTGTIRLALNYLSFAISSVLRAMFLKKDFDAILVYQLSPITMALPAIILKKITKKPLIIYCHDLWPESIASAGIAKESMVYKILLRVSQWIYKQADEIFTSSKMFSEYFRNTIKYEKEITHLPVYAEALFENIKKSAKNADTINLLFAGNIGEMQSVDTIIHAANELKNDNNIKIHIVGDGSSRDKCEMLAKQLGLENVIFHGHHPINQMPQYYEMADAFLITLKANKVISYTLPNKVQSYMAAGKPIIGAIDGETKYVIDESQCGLCSPAEDYKQLAANIQKFANERQKQNIYGENSKKYYNSHFSKEIYIQKLIKSINKAAE
ncbi:glycosyltransferase family 4 protein [Paenibacillus luteus]|uniref:glycosyltransferase family 4 protein n=1 Tax=Paenibacillus luteus TaxID=2545753 RepID=UPI0011432E36|nr:glycosyltransferase family 4 protein [Paenibacillus luteus]